MSIRRSLYWKICLTFLVVVFVSVIAGSTVFSTISHQLLGPLRRESMLSLAHMGLREVRLFLQRGGRPEDLPAHLGEVFRDFPHITILHAGRDGRIFGKEEAERPELRRMFEEAYRHGLPTEGQRIEFLGPGRGAMIILPVGPKASLGHALLAGRGALEDVLPIALRAGTASLVAVLLVAAVLGLLVFRVLGRRIAQVRRALVGVADGDLTLRVRDDVADEIGELGQAFNVMADRLQRSVQELASIDERRRRFFADISHELKTPVTALRGHLERLLARPHDPGSVQALKVAFEEVDRLFLLIEDLLELARMDTTDFRLKTQEEVLQRVASRAAERFQVALENRSITLTTRLSPEPVRRAVDARRLEQVVANLLLNAIHSMPDGGSIELTVEERGGKAVLAVTDQGPGIPEDQRRQVFERFVTGGTDTGGTGLGLSIVKRLVEAHGGVVRLEPGTLGKGTRAVVELA